MPIYKSCIGCLLCGVLLFTSPAQSAERILSFSSDIEILQDGSMVVTETIRVRAEGKQIRRGVYRDFPTKYRSHSGDNYVVDFELIQVSRDGKAEPHHSKSLPNGVRVYMGQKDVYLDPGEYSYKISYRTDRQLGFFADHDELYWNVTGNDWAFAIDKVYARVDLPPQVVSHNTTSDGFTGYFGEYGKDFQAVRVDADKVEFATTRPLRPREGFSIVVTWPKGYVREPTSGEKIGYFVRDNGTVFIAVTGLSVLLLYYFTVWMKLGRDPASGTIIPLFYPPANLSPAAMRYIYRMGFDNKAYAAAIINMAVKGALTIDNEENTYVINRVAGADESSLSPGERSVLRPLLREKQSLSFKRQHHAAIGKSIKALKALLKREYHSVQFKTNSGYLVPGVILSILILAISGFRGSEGTVISLLLMSIWLAGWSFTLFVLVRQRQFLMFIIFAFFEIAALTAFLQMGGWPLFLLLAVLIVLNIVFYYLMKAPTDAGRKLLDKIEGFRLYLATAEEERLNTLNPPEQTPQLFEKYLPYALALGVDQAWSERFAAKLQTEAKDPQAKTYRPRWYSGADWDRFNPTSFSTTLGASLSKAVAASSSAPGSSSGSGGGGFSGGGGGGGGGGGW